jgi:hypothetical protein
LSNPDRAGTTGVTCSPDEPDEHASLSVYQQAEHVEDEDEQQNQPPPHEAPISGSAMLSESSRVSNSSISNEANIWSMSIA